MYGNERETWLLQRKIHRVKTNYKVWGIYFMWVYFGVKYVHMVKYTETIFLYVYFLVK